MAQVEQSRSADEQKDCMHRATNLGDLKIKLFTGPEFMKKKKISTPFNNLNLKKPTRV